VSPVAIAASKAFFPNLSALEGSAPRCSNSFTDSVRPHPAYPTVSSFLAAQKRACSRRRKHAAGEGVTCCHVERGLPHVLACAVGVSTGIQQRCHLVLMRSEMSRAGEPDHQLAGPRGRRAGRQREAVADLKAVGGGPVQGRASVPVPFVEAPSRIDGALDKAVQGFDVGALVHYLHAPLPPGRCAGQCLRARRTQAPRAVRRQVELQQGAQTSHDRAASSSTSVRSWGPHTRASVLSRTLQRAARPGVDA
jgi:hypothetical protein